MSDLEKTLASLADPRLDGAACKGKAPLFDDRGPRESWYNYRARIAEARSYCQVCKIRTVCAQIIEETPRTRRAGMWAGHVQGEA
ncbi:WhiB family transcriptional regulator [Dietzia timorensis]|uniref:4Fe-4S Wbl-type domain-containing protein n=1 Tax=Dietzia timorensis TaxID=499555 RepID=A0A173LIQ8_9ACTN|nr:Hypothetical protein BJL86_0875 [Dietzia timorensis]